MAQTKTLPQVEPLPHAEIVINPPDAAERELISIMDPIVDEIESRIEETLQLFFKLRGEGVEERAEEARQDGFFDDSVLLRFMLKRVQNKYLNERSLKNRAYARVGKQVDHFAFSQVETGFQKVFGPKFKVHVSPRGQRARLSKEFVSKMGSVEGQVETDLFGNVQNALSEGLRQRKSPAELLGMVASSAAKSKLKLRFIARKEVNALHTGVNRHIQKFMGVKKYRWSTEEDEKVRPRHVLRHGKIYRWTYKHSDGHPGMPHNCRCQAIPVIDLEMRATWSLTENQLRIQAREPIRPPWIGKRRKLRTIADVDLGKGMPNFGQILNPLSIVRGAEGAYEAARESVLNEAPKSPGKIADFYRDEMIKARARRKRDA